MLPAGNGSIDSLDRRQITWGYGIIEPIFRRFTFWRQDDRSGAAWAPGIGSEGVWSNRAPATPQGWVKDEEITDE
jgi:hypothetical protein